VEYSFDEYGRFSSVQSAQSADTNLFTYSYLPGSHRLQGYTATKPVSGFEFQVSKTYEPGRDLITAVTNTFGSAIISAFNYENDALGRRTARTDITPTLTVNNTFDYNLKSEVTNAVMGSNTYSYDYDPIGNRLQSTVDSGQSSVTNSYTANGLNQYTAISNQQSSIRSPAYDSDGNMTSDGGGWHYAWNGENRLVLASNAVHTVAYAYDHQGRMARKTVAFANALPERQINYVWDDYNIIAEHVIVNGMTDITYNVWGLDLSGTLQGAGGVGGLLAVTVSNPGTLEPLNPETFYPLFDANGNITEYVATNGTVAAHYEYSAFGETTAQSGDFAETFTHRFSTKPWCGITGMSEHELRKYRPDLGRYISWQVSDETIAIEYVRNLYNFLEKEVQYLHIGVEALAPLKGLPLGSVKCNITGSDGEPSFISENNDNNSTRQCTGLHEYQHIKDRQSCCYKAREAYRKNGKVGRIIAQWNAYIRLTRDWSECRAYEKSLSCAEELKCKVPKDQEEWLNSYIEKSAKRKKEHCNKASEPMPCPF